MKDEFLASLAKLHGVDFILDLNINPSFISVNREIKEMLMIVMIKSSMGGKGCSFRNGATIFIRFVGFAAACHKIED